MADTSNQAPLPRATLQNEVDFQTGKAGGYMFTFDVKNKTGDCVLPPFVNARFINCTFTSLKTTGTNIIYMKDCKLQSSSGSYKIQNAAIIAENTIFGSRIQFDQSKLELLKCTINQNILLNNVSFLKTIRCKWQVESGSFGQNAVTLDGSRFESYQDNWGTWNDYVIVADNKSFAKIVRPTNITLTKQLGSLDHQSGLSLWDLPDINAKVQTEEALFLLDNGSLLEIYNFGNISSYSSIFDVTASKVIVRALDSLQSTNFDIGTFDEGSTVDISDITSILAPKGSAINGTDSNITLKKIDKISVKDSVLNLDNSSFLFIGESFDYTDSSATGTVFTTTGSADAAFLLTNSNVTVKNVVSFISNIDTIFLDNSTLSFSNCNKISSTNGVTLNPTNGSTATFDKIDSLISVSGDYVVNASASKVYIGDVTTSLSANGGTALYFTDGATGVVKSIKKLQGGISAIEVTNASLVVENKQNYDAIIIGGTSPVIDMGINGRVSLRDISNITGNATAITTDKNGMLEIKNVPSIDGDIQVDSTDVIIDNSEISGTITGGITVNSDFPGGYILSLRGPLTVSGDLQADNYVLDYSGVTFSGNVDLTNCIVTERASIIQGTFTSSSSYINSVLVNTQGDITLSNNSVMRVAGYTAGASSSLTQSVISAWSSKFEDVTLDSCAGFSFDLGSAGAITATDSFIKTFGGKIGSTSYAGSSTLLGGVISPVTITTPDDPAYTPKAFFTIGGDMELEADGTMYLSADKLDAEFREHALIEVTTVSTITMTTSDITIDSTTVNITP